MFPDPSDRVQDMLSAYDEAPDGEVFPKLDPNVVNLCPYCFYDLHYNEERGLFYCHDCSAWFNDDFTEVSW